MSDDNTDRLMAVLRGAQPALAKFARESFDSEGRGIVRVSLPALPNRSGTALVETEMVYHSLRQMRELLEGVKDREDADVTIRMIETYDPGRQAVVIVAFAGGLPVTVKMKLDPPFFVEDAGGVH